MLYLSYVMLYLPCMKCSSVKLRCGKLCATDLHAHGDCYWQGEVMMAKIVHSAVNDRAADAPALHWGREAERPDGHAWCSTCMVMDCAAVCPWRLALRLCCVVCSPSDRAKGISRSGGVALRLVRPRRPLQLSAAGQCQPCEREPKTASTSCSAQREPLNSCPPASPNVPGPTPGPLPRPGSVLPASPRSSLPSKSDQFP